MNNDSTSVSGPPATSPHVRSGSSSRRRRHHSKTPAQKRAYEQMRKKYELASSLMTNLDFAVYCQLCVLYYMDCSFFQLCMRALTQFVILTPKPKNVRPPPQNSSLVIMLLGTNILCIFLHIFLAPSGSSEEMRGYLHGGIIIDLIGQKGPSSRLKLAVFDLLVLTLQSVLFAIHLDREKLDKFLTVYGQKTTEAQIPPSTQDYDAEERGVLRDSVAGLGDIEMQPLNSAGGASRPHGQEYIPEADEEDEREELLAEPVNTESDDAPLDIFWSGTAVIGEFSVLDTLRSQLAVSGTASGSLRTNGLSANVAELTSRNPRLNFIARRFQRNM
ncbi:hypothetical protein SS1G_04437 [Sclerotinia sclerotiorum 1980 UF-70]|uniref:DUF1746 domain-containing protein n=2 Tax=Sclerotinia sclerotiorum (strain ATCC 18683 / 1980 / Ss-1) TaxID=665079 RepID=A7EGJ6_SCLS1|nr:hypothetical protein SS1G_04437 [Sclerotinia sclerotiorum 1980 UF-70]APA06911.1 hypothetical protein sscle_02g016810 [Sclerotinia sclerotiorum 1980 UF-70]EDO01962.1 hypothetical protein SS1G_04437 [Sclerotinia sclerotiorum 1980 UF-70]